MEPNHRINGLEFGREHSVIRDALGDPIRIIKDYDSESIIEVYPTYHVYYAKDNKFEAIEFFGNNVHLSINSQLFYPGTLNDAREILPDLEEKYGTYLSKKYSVGFSVEEDKIISVLVGREGYYNQLFD